MKYIPVKSIYYLAVLMGSSDMVTTFLYVIILKYIIQRRKYVTVSILELEKLMEILL